MNIEQKNLESDDGDGVGFGFGLGGAGLVAGGLLVFTGIGLIPIALTALGSGLGIGALFGETKEAKIKRIILEKGIENFNNSVEEIVEQILEEFVSIFDDKKEVSSTIIREATLTIENLMVEQESISEKSQQVEQIQKDFSMVLLN